ncbi:hypothetical protein ACVMB3_005227 [Sinorhizobium meliloti]|nr:hypothetical protein SinmeB_6016 [Sinorhizobium meliloti BL225C]SDZ53942.1 hypothetical protein SAMN04244576_06381 [Sinorhizobium meliloti]
MKPAHRTEFLTVPFGAVVRDNHAGFASPFNQCRQFASNTTARDRRIWDCRQAFARDVVDHIEDAKAPAAGELIVDEIQRPACIGLCCDQDRRTRADSTTPGLPLAHGKTFLAIEPVDAIDTGRLTISPKQNEQASVAEAPPLIGEIAQLRSQLQLRRSTGSITDRLAVGRYDLAGPPFRKPHCDLQMRDGFTLGGRPYHFFPRSSRRAATSSICSASSFFSLAFSSSSAFNAVEHVGQIGLRIDAVHLGRLDYRHGTCQCLRAGVSASEEPIFSSDSHPPFILPMSAMKSRFIIAGIHILGKRLAFAASTNERQASFCMF